ncbi:MAG: aldehyde ferredoxin oxidoreductase N-terminal domain-containing protein [Coriobacteriia bacterium]
MSNGFAGKIIKIDLTTRKVDVIDSEPYKGWGGGHGLGSALFWEMCKDKTVGALDPGNVVTVCPGRFAGTLAPSAARTEVQGFGPQGYPVEWFTRSNFGGRWGGMLKLAGYDGVAVVGKASAPVWIDIRDDSIEIRDADKNGDALWGLDVFDAQKRIWDMMGSADGKWAVGATRDAGRTIQRAAVLTIGPAGENLTRNAALLHDGGAGAGQGGFGAVFGSKNLKAISVLGTGSIDIADPAALMDTRLWLKKGYMFDVENVQDFDPAIFTETLVGIPNLIGGGTGAGRPEGCMSCHKSCHGTRVTEGIQPGSSCDDTWYSVWEQKLTPIAGVKMLQGSNPITGRATELMQRLGINAYMGDVFVHWLHKLHEKGLVGKGKLIDTDLFDKYQLGTFEFAEAMLNRMAYREEIGALMAEGPARMAVKLGRFDEDTTSGDLPLQEYGWTHHYDGRTEAEWGYGSILSSRDVNEHDFCYICYWKTSLYSLLGMEMEVTAEEMAELIGAKLLPYADPMMINYSDEAIYSESMVKLVSWHRAYGLYFKEALGLCDWAYADFLNVRREDKSGATPEVETRLVHAIMDKDQSFEDGMKIGTRIWNLDRAIYAMQGRTREDEVFAEYMYQTPAAPGFTSWEVPYVMPVHEDGKWSYKSVSGRTLDKAKMESWKTAYYTFEGWDPKTGQPTAAALGKLDLADVAEELKAAGKLGESS